MIKPFRGDFRLTQGFGENPASYAKFGLKGHNGLDYGLPTGTDIIAPHSGKVVEASFDAGGYGLYLKIENDKEGSILAHLKDNLVSIGTEVSEGQLIAHSDNTGNSTGPHLHWGYYNIPRDRTNGYSGCINQISLITHPTVEPMATITQKELDSIIKSRDENWNNFKKTEVKLADTEDKLEDALNMVSQVQKEFDEYKKNNENVTFEVPVESTTLSETVSTATTEVINPDTNSSSPSNQPEKDLFTLFLEWLINLLRKLKS